LTTPLGPNKPQGPGEILEERGEDIEDRDEDIEDRDEDIEGRDEDFEVVCESVKKGDSLAESYLDWLKLFIIHFDAISILIGYVTGPEFGYNAISIEIVVPPRVVPDILPWRELFSKNFLPTYTAPQIPLPNVNYQVEDNEIIDFLTKAIGALAHFENAGKEWENGNKAATIQCFEALKKTNVKSWTEWAEGMIAKLKSNDSPYVWTNDGSETSDTWPAGIATEITNSRNGAVYLFFDALRKDKEFGGAIHCEACLVSLLIEDSLVSKDILARMKVSQVSDLFLSRVSFLVKGFWTGYWDIKALLPSMHGSSHSLKETAIHRKRRSPDRFSLHSAHMASKEDRGFNE
jgi:hypothetical protein